MECLLGIEVDESVEREEEDEGDAETVLLLARLNAQTQQPAQSSSQPARRRGPLNWVHVVELPSEAEVLAVRRRMTVSKNKTAQQGGGLKTLYKCNRRHTTACAFQMYTLQKTANGPVSVYQCGEHNHSTKLKGRTSSSSGQQAVDMADLNGTGAVTIACTPMSLSPLQSSMPNKEEHGRRMHSAPSEHAVEVASSAHSSTGGVFEDGDHQFRLADGERIGELLGLATDLELTMTFNGQKSGEYVFSGSADAMRAVVLADVGETMCVSVRQGGEIVDVEVWKKADWRQFLWALRGKCLKSLC